MYSPPDKAWEFITEHDLPVHIIHMSEGGGLPPQDIVVTGFHADDNGVVFVRNSKRGRSWELPTGRVEQNESVETALHRELLEETGREVQAASPELAVLWVFPEKTMTNIVFNVELGETVSAPEDEVDDVATFEDIPEQVSFNDSGRVAYEYILSELVDNEPHSGSASRIPVERPSNRMISAIAGLTVSGVVVAGAAHKFLSEEDTGDTDASTYTDFDWKTALETVKER